MLRKPFSNNGTSLSLYGTLENARPIYAVYRPGYTSRPDLSIPKNLEKHTFDKRGFPWLEK
jgi:hypothetical protein